MEPGKKRLLKTFLQHYIFFFKSLESNLQNEDAQRQPKDRNETQGCTIILNNGFKTGNDVCECLCVRVGLFVCMCVF